ncbi:MAG: hypothetical protein Q7S74_02760 [Nanoarchaeota archaeon]|nr:hypothetical protein [Nanoarchaeota archaeon]
MNLRQELKNIKGDFKGHPRCCITGDTLYKTEVYAVPFNNGGEVIIISAKSLEVEPIYDIAGIIHNRVNGDASRNCYSIDEIASLIPGGCIKFMRE